MKHWASNLATISSRDSSLGDVPATSLERGLRAPGLRCHCSRLPRMPGGRPAPKCSSNFRRRRICQLACTARHRPACGLLAGVEASELVDVALPVSGYAASGSGDWLAERVMRGRGQSWTGERLLRLVVPEPAFTWFEALDDRVAVVCQCSVACCEGDVSQQPTCPHSAQRRRCTHQPPVASHSTQPVPLGGTVALMPAVTINQLPECQAWVRSPDVL